MSCQLHGRWRRSGKEEWIMRKFQCAVVGTALLFMPLNLLASAKNHVVGTVDFSGDSQFDADSISAICARFEDVLTCFPYAGLEDH
jgi:hypothetical protein